MDLGCIINIASLLGMKGGKGSAGYAASKAGVIGRLVHLPHHSLANVVRVDSSISRGIGYNQSAGERDSARLH